MITKFLAFQIFTARANARKLLVLMLLGVALACASLNSYALSASVDRDTISLQETFTLTLRQSGRSNDSPDLTPLQKDFEILNTQQSSQVVNINGQVDAYTDWHIALAPKKSGVFTIPALKFDGASSQPILITVQPQSQAPDSASSSVFLEVETDKDSAYVQEQILFTVRLYTAVSLNGVELQPLELNGAVVVPLDEKQYQTTLNGRPHAVVETRYAIYPQSSGKLIIPSLTYNVSTGGQRDLWSQIYGNRQNNLLRLRSEEQQLDINAMPSQFAGAPWLPARKITLSEHWSASRDQLKVGEPVTRSITITAEGLTAGQISPLTPDNIDGLTFYPDQAQTDEQKTAEGVTGTRIETFAIVPNRSGEFTLPAITLNWWDTSANKMQTAQLPETVVNVADNPFATTPSTPINTDYPSVPVPTQAQGTSPATPTIVAPIWLIIVAGASALVALIFALLYWKARRELRAIYAVYMEEKNQQSLAENTAWANLKRASAADDLPALRKALLEWAQIHWQDQNIHSLQAMGQHTDNSDLREQLRKLDEALYGGTLAEKWDTGELLQQVHACRRDKRDKQREEEGLKPLYKS